MTSNDPLDDIDSASKDSSASEDGVQNSNTQSGSCPSTDSGGRVEGDTDGIPAPASFDADNEGSVTAEPSGEQAALGLADDDAGIELISRGATVSGHYNDEELLALSAARRKRRWPKVLLVACIAVVVVFGCAIGALAYDDSQRTQKVPQGTILDDSVDISGMTKQELEATITARVQNGLSTQVTVLAADQTFIINAGDIGTVDLDATVTEAFAPYGEDFFARCYDRIKGLVSGEQGDYAVTTVINVDSELLSAKIDEIANEVNVEAKSAGYEYADDGLVTTEAVQGLALDTEATTSLVSEALSGTSGSLQVEAVTTVTEPESTDPGKAIYVNTKTCNLYLYDEGEVTFTCLCSPGRLGYETPTGDFYLEYKVKNPTWTNPGSDWAKNMPETIGPGESNPMGLRKLALSCGGGIFIHGTTNTGALGSRDSHGCIRISNANVVELYDMVDVGIPIIVR